MAAPDDVTVENEAVPPRQLGVLWVLMAVSSVALFTWAVSQHRLVLGLVLMIVAAFAGMVGVFAAIRYVAQEHGAFRVSVNLALLAGAGSVAGAAVVWQGFNAEQQVVTAVGVAMLLHSVAFLSDSFNQAVQPRQGATRQTLSIFLANGVMFLATLFVSLEDRLTRRAALLTAVYLFALVVLKLTVVQFVESEGEQKQRRNLLTWVTAIVAMVLGSVALVAGGWFMLVWAGSLLVGGLSALGLLVHNQVSLPDILGGKTLFDSLLTVLPDRLSATARRVVSPAWLGTLVGALLGVGSFLSLDRLMEGTWAPFAVAVIVVIVGAFFVLPGETIFGAVLLGLLIVWVAQDTDSAVPAEDNAAIVSSAGASEAWVVALGDSFISGEGAPLFHEGTNSPGSNDCRRAPTGYPQVVGRALGMRVMSFACSGAEVRHLLEEIQKPDSPANIAGGAPQLTALTEWLTSSPAPDVDMVLVSIGGNDSGFGDVITACLLPGANCAEVEAAFMQRVAALEDELVVVYRELLDTLDGAEMPGGRPRVLVVPYPDPIGAAGVDCSLVLSEVESSFIRRFRVALNEQVAKAVSSVSGIELVESAQSLAGHELCTDEPFVNWLTLSPPDGDFLEAVNPKHWINGSLHPGVGGHCVAALLIVDAWDADVAPARLPDCERPPATSVAPAPFATSLPELCRASDAEADKTGRDCTKLWNDAAVDAAGRSVMFAAALALGAGLVSAGALSGYTPRSRLRGVPAKVWSVIRRVWLDYDKVAHGPRARQDEFSSPKRT